METIGISRVVRFSSFEADLRTRELRKHGLKLKLQDQPFQVLAMLLERPGELVSREEIRARLWPQDTFVDFDHGLNAAVRRLRDTLNDNADTPRFVETLPKRGYRFIASVEKLSVEGALPGEARPLPQPPAATAGGMETNESDGEAVHNFGTPARIETNFQRVAVAAKPASVIVSSLLQTVISQDGVPSASPNPAPDGKKTKARQSKRARVLVSVVVIMGVVSAALVAYQVRSKRVSQPAISPWPYFLFRTFPAIRRRNISQTE